MLSKHFMQECAAFYVFILQNFGTKIARTCDKGISKIQTFSTNYSKFNYHIYTFDEMFRYYLYCLINFTFETE